MANYRNDPTGNAAAGAVDREIRQKRKEAERAARLILSGRLSREEENQIRRQFTGIFRRLLEEELKNPAPPREDFPRKNKFRG